MVYIPMNAVTVWESGATRRTLADVEGAASFLLTQWPEPYSHTDRHVAARVAALDALEGNAPVDAFRAALEAAAEEAGILAEPMDIEVTGIPSRWRKSRRRR